MKALASMIALTVFVLIAPAFAGVATIRSKAECEKAGGRWEAVGDKCIGADPSVISSETVLPTGPVPPPDATNPDAPPATSAGEENKGKPPIAPQ